MLLSITEKIIKDPNDSIYYEDAYRLAVSQDNAVDLIMCASKIREKYKKNIVFTCSIINAKSGRCSEDCAFCAQSAHHKTGIESYPLLDKEKMVNNSILMEKAGATKYSMVTSGHSLSDGEIDSIGHTAEEINKKTDLSVCASLGQLTEPMAIKLKEMGVTTYHHNLETARSYFDQICTTHDYDEDIQTVKIAKSAGLRVCSGGILGLGETWAQRVELAFTLKELDVDSIPINFLNPIPGTRMENRSLIPPMEALKSIAIFRFINPDKDITICGGREKTLGDFQSWIFMAGANGIMIGNYLTTKGRSAEMDIDMIRQIDLSIEKGA
ncbi:MAG: biotin synthase BioB [Proteobacteria bacterium]|nr:biotin synthase BioB [Pseudomonadota bacterium]MBU4259881.1 biotin synthase BioB [Pseudomonadota bacterium]MBU4286896.1 biotin synthase BioB [Pseudomonadota bacterium]MCG2758584.1 biotin synthase BioB [Desulfobacteraceae bacterium]